MVVAEVVVISISLFDCCMSIFPAGAMVQDLEVSTASLFCPTPSFPAVLCMPHFLLPSLLVLLQPDAKAQQVCTEAPDTRAATAFLPQTDLMPSSGRAGCLESRTTLFSVQEPEQAPYTLQSPAEICSFLTLHPPELDVRITPDLDLQPL